MKQGIKISPHEVGATRRCNFVAKPRLRPLRPQDQANVHVTCTMSRLQRIARDPREPPAQCAGAYLRWTVGAARNGASNCELQEMKTVKTRQAKQARSTHQGSNAIHRHTNNFTRNSKNSHRDSNFDAPSLSPAQARA